VLEKLVGQVIFNKAGERAGNGRANIQETSMRKFASSLLSMFRPFRAGRRWHRICWRAR
jgi:hypothetical protein